MKKAHKSLIMCTTPLQMLIAEKIIDLKKNQIFDLLLISNTRNEKYDYYFNRLSEKCDQSLFYTLKTSRNSFFNFIWQLNKSNLTKNYKEVYLASIDSSYFSYIVSKLNEPIIYTFDDGTGNINNESIYYIPPKPTRLKQAALNVLGIKYSINKLKKSSVLHYTIYKDVPNIVNKTKFINLIDTYYKSVRDNISENSRNIKVKILLGQPLEEISPHFSYFDYNSLIKKFDINYYFQHPRQKVIPKNNLTVIKTNLIFEDYIVKLLQDDPDLTIEVYSFNSSAAINVANIDRVKVNIIYDSVIQSKSEDFYNLLDNHFNVTTVYP